MKRSRRPFALGFRLQRFCGIAKHGRADRLQRMMIACLWGSGHSCGLLPIPGPQHNTSLTCSRSLERGFVKGGEKHSC